MARFEGTDNYVATNDLKMAVNAAITLERPLLIKGEPGTDEYDAVARLRDSQLGDDRVHDIKNYINKGKVWEAFESDVRPILLIDEIDKADIEFPNDLLHELDKMSFSVLRRCFFHYIQFPDEATMADIVKVHFPDLKQRLLSASLKRFFEVRAMPGLKKKPSTSELLDWLKLLLVEDIDPEIIKEADPKKMIPPLHGALLKNEQDVHLFERLAFLSRRGS